MKWFISAVENDRSTSTSNHVSKENEENAQDHTRTAACDCDTHGCCIGADSGREPHRMGLGLWHLVHQWSGLKHIHLYLASDLPDPESVQRLVLHLQHQRADSD